MLFPPVDLSRQDDPLVRALTGREFEKLATLARLVRKGAFVIALYNTDASRRALIADLRRRIAPLPLWEHRITPAQPDPVAYLDALSLTERYERGVVCIYDLAVGWPDAAHWLDLERDELARYPHVLILWIEGYLWGKLAEAAPNFFSRHSGVFDLRLTETPGKSVGTAAQQASPISGIRFESLAEWEQLVTLFSGLLAEYESDQGKNEATRRDLHERLGRLYAARADYQQARRHFQQAYALLDDGAEPSVRADLLYWLGRMRYYTGERREDLEAAVASYGEALRLFREVGARLGEANVLLSWGDLLRKNELFAEATTRYELALGLYQAIADNYSTARVLYRQGDLYMAQEAPEQALPLYEQAATLWRRIGLDDLVEDILQPRRQWVLAQLAEAAPQKGSGE